MRVLFPVCFVCAQLCRAQAPSLTSVPRWCPQSLRRPLPVSQRNQLLRWGYRKKGGGASPWVRSQLWECMGRGWPLWPGRWGPHAHSCSPSRLFHLQTVREEGWRRITANIHFLSVSSSWGRTCFTRRKGTDMPYPFLINCPTAWWLLSWLLTLAPVVGHLEKFQENDSREWILQFAFYKKNLAYLKELMDLIIRDCDLYCCSWGDPWMIGQPLATCGYLNLN